MLAAHLFSRIHQGLLTSKYSTGSLLSSNRHARSSSGRNGAPRTTRMKEGWSITLRAVSDRIGPSRVPGYSIALQINLQFIFQARNPALSDWLIIMCPQTLLNGDQIYQPVSASQRGSLIDGLVTRLPRNDYNTYICIAHESKPTTLGLNHTLLIPMCVTPV